ncbi:MAG: NTP transferase domain-containing protein, partial [Treponema sp.]|nr:NTP transferase domain-containing protein [Treponema sp.]
MTILALQARLDSSRLPGKAMLPLGGRPLVFRVMDALRFLPCDKKVLACSQDSVSSFAPLAEEAGFDIIPGPKDDVLARYCLVIRKTGAERVIRATGDNPFVFTDAAALLNEEAMAHNADYAGYSEIPPGAGVESVSAAALLRAEMEARSLAEREHVCPYLYGNPEKFKLYMPSAPIKWRRPDIRITIDTEEDYKTALVLYEELLSL